MSPTDSLLVRCTPALIAALVVLADMRVVAAQMAKQAEVHAHLGHVSSVANATPTETKPPGAFAEQPASTRRMNELIQEIWRGADPRKNPFRSDEQIKIYEQALAANPPLDARLDLLPQYGIALVQSGRSEEALAQYEEFERLLRENNRPLGPRVLPGLLILQAICHLRTGEQENCLAGHNADSCLFPIRGGGVHTKPRGSRAAIVVLNRLLEKYPSDLRGRWLLNVAYMTLGEYPDGMPEKFRIDPQLFASEYDIKRFPDVAAKLGLDINDLAGGTVLEDFDGDGFLDLMTSAWGFTPDNQLRVFRNQGNGTFTERTSEAGLSGVVSGLNMIQGDYNNDGHLDVLVLRGAWLHGQGKYPNSLLRNNGDFTFTDVTVETGLLSFHPTQAAVWFDFNADGWLDIYIGNESSERDPHPCELFRNNGDGTFTECAGATGVDHVAFVKGVAAGDYNNDGRPDLLLSTQDGPKVLFRNEGPISADRSTRASWRFTNVTDAAGITEPWASFGCWFWDYDNDGQLDITVNGYGFKDVGDVAADVLGLPHSGHRTRLYRNLGNGTFADVSKEAGVLKLVVTMGHNFGDLDNDGWLDFYCGTGNPDFGTLVPNRMFRNDGGRRFQDVTTSGGFGQLQKGHGIAFGDIDNDGDQDIYSNVGGAADADRYHNQLFANPGHGNHWLKLKLEGVRTNRPAIGARVKVVAQTGSGERALYRTVGSGASFGASSFRVEVGLGDARAISRVEIFWPTTGATQVLRGFALDHAYHVREDADAATPTALGTFALPGPDAPDHPHGGGVHGCCAAAAARGETCLVCNPAP